MSKKKSAAQKSADEVNLVESKITETLAASVTDAGEEAEYNSHKEQILHALPPPERVAALETALLSAYEKVISYRQVPFVMFGELNAEELAQAFVKYPMIIKPTLSCVNVAGRAIKRDLGIDIDTYGKSITAEQASLLAGYIKPFLPDTIAIPALMELDRYFWTDKEMRARKGQWEKTVTDALIVATGLNFKKCRFLSGDNSYELDAAYPSDAETIEIGIDIKRIESTRDIHKRADEIINKAVKFKASFPEGVFIAVVYFPFPTQHINLQSRLHSKHIDHLFFAGESNSSIISCVEMLAGVLKPRKKKVRTTGNNNYVRVQKPTLALSSLLWSAKRTANERRGIHAWHPYYAGYSEAFVDSALNFLESDANCLILDPWGGSGTTGAVSARRGITSISIDINPVMATFAAGKSKDVLMHRSEILEYFKSDAWTHSPENEHKEDHLTSKYSLGTACTIRHIIDSIPASAGLPPAMSVQQDLAICAAFDPTHIVNPLYAFYMAVIFVTLRRLLGTAKLANPTWIRIVEEKIDLDVTFFRRELVKSAEEMLATLDSFYGLRELATGMWSIAGDARSMPIQNESVDRIITSPPYLTRIDYAVSTTPELYLFGDDDLVTFVRHKTIGAPVITKNEKEQRPEWGRLCNSILDAIASHPAKASKSYYWKNIVQYFMDIDAALDDIHRVLKPGGSGLIVVQSSYFKEIEIPLGEIYVEMARAKGFESSIAFREEVKGHMAHVNTKSSKYKTNKVYFEDAVYISKH